MLKRTVFMALAAVAALAGGCTKYGLVDDGKGDSKAVDVRTAGQAAAPLYAKTTFKLGIKASGYRWTLDGKEVSTASTYVFTPAKQGEYRVELEASGVLYVCRVFAVRPVTDGSSKWISEVMEYRPAPGQFINTDAWGTLARAQSIVGAQQELGERPGVSLGAFGGYVVFRFDHSVTDKSGYDFVIRSNTFEGGSEPGAVMVAFDRNGNGRPDEDEWYELAGEDHTLESTKKNFTITYARPSDLSKSANVYWAGSDGTSGFLDAETMNPFHKQSYWPLFLPDSPSALSFTGTCLRNLSEDRSGGSSGQNWYCAAAGKGYADNYSPDYEDIVNLDPDTKKSNKFDLANAVDGQGRSVVLPAVDFIKVYTCVNQAGGWLGEGSTEVCGAISLSAPK